MATTQSKTVSSKKATRRLEQNANTNTNDAEGLPSDENILSGNPLAEQRADNSDSAAFADKQNFQPTLGDDLTEEQRREHISVAAYYNAEKRGFSGDEQQQLEDWLQAEKLIGNYYSGGTSNNRDQPSIQQIINQTDARLDDVDARSDNAQIIDPSDIKRWAKELGVSAAVLREAINRVGGKVDDVKNFLADSDTQH